jgi:hypothetical protein
MEIGFDPWQSAQMSTSLLTSGANVVEFRQILSNFSEPTKELDALMRNGAIAHNANPVWLGASATLLGITTQRKTFSRAKNGLKTKLTARLR